MRVVIVGAGYVGLVSGVCFADFGHQVICVDKDCEKIKKLKKSIVPIYEPGLEQLISKNVKAGRLSFTTNLKSAMKEASVVFIAVGTPARRGDGHADLTHVFEASEEIGRSIDEYTVIVTKSTVPVGTGDKVERIISKFHSTEKFSVVSNPEFLREGAAIEDFKRPDRVVLGVHDKRAEDTMRALYRPLNLNEVPIIVTSRRTSELIKYAANSYLATKITFINEISDLCEEVGANVQEVAKGIGLDNRIGSKFLHVGPGYGGSCFPKDTLALTQTAKEAKVPLSIINSVVKANESRKLNMAKKVIRILGGDINGKTIAILGLSFKPNTDDMRDAPSLTIIPFLQEKGAKIRVYDPQAMTEASHLLKNVNFTKNAYDCVKEADALVIITEWDEFRALDIDRIKNELKLANIIDLRNIYKPKTMKLKKINYHSLGRPNSMS
jgi:UDPglucose 6-dehydrogenase